MSGTTKLLDRIEIILGSESDPLPVYIDVYDNNLSRKWLAALDHLITNNYHLEKNYCWFGFVEGERTPQFLCDRINSSIQAINNAGIGYTIDDYFSPENTIKPGPIGDHLPGGYLEHDKFNQLHRYFEDLQGVSGAISNYFWKADNSTRWHIRQLNLLCHEYESLILSLRQAAYAPMWRRPSQLMCWLNAPRFVLEEQDFELFGIETMNRPLGGVYCGINKAIGKSHWEVFWDEGKDGTAIDELTTTTLRGQTEAAGDFDIEWANNPGDYHWQKTRLAEFRQWLITNGFDPEDKSLTIGHPQIGQVDLNASFGTEDYKEIWQQLSQHLNVFSICTSKAAVVYDYKWSDHNYMALQIEALGQ